MAHSFITLALLVATASAQTLRKRACDSNGYCRVEVYRNGNWGTICDDGFGASDGRVICETGFGESYVGWKTVSSSQQGSGLIGIDNLRCSGTESSLSSCNYNGWGNHDCGHSEDVAIKCGSSTKSTGSCSSNSQCSSGSCKGGSCCTSKGMSTGCTECNRYDGECESCSSGYRLSSYQCVSGSSGGSSGGSYASMMDPTATWKVTIEKSEDVSGQTTIIREEDADVPSGFNVATATAAPVASCMEPNDRSSLELNNFMYLAAGIDIESATFNDERFQGGKIILPSMSVHLMFRSPHYSTVIYQDGMGGYYPDLRISLPGESSKDVFFGSEYSSSPKNWYAEYGSYSYGGSVPEDGKVPSELFYAVSNFIPVYSRQSDTQTTFIPAVLSFNITEFEQKSTIFVGQQASGRLGVSVMFLEGTTITYPVKFAFSEMHDLGRFDVQCGLHPFIWTVFFLLVATPIAACVFKCIRKKKNDETKPPLLTKCQWFFVCLTVLMWLAYSGVYLAFRDKSIAKMVGLFGVLPLFLLTTLLISIRRCRLRKENKTKVTAINPPEENQFVDHESGGGKKVVSVAPAAVAPAPVAKPVVSRSSKPVGAWSVDDCVDFFTEQGLPEAAGAVKKEQFDGSVLADIEEDDLESALNVTSHLKRKQIMKALAE